MIFKSIVDRLHGVLGRHAKKTCGTNYLVATIAVTYRCQLKCDHCGSGRYNKDKQQELTTDEVKAAMRDLAEIGSRSIAFFGGEPLLREDLYDLIRYARELGLGTSMDTNAVAMTPECAGKLARAGLNMLYISLDSARPEVHDKHRKTPGLFNRAVDAIKYCKDLGLQVRIGTYVDREKLNNGDLGEMLELGRKLGVPVRILTTVLAGRLLDEEEQKLTPEEIRRFKSMLIPGESFWEQDSCAGAAAPFVCTARTRDGIYITAYGDVTPCVYVPLSFGNIRREPLTKIARRMWRHKMFDCRAGTDCLMNDGKFREEYFGKVALSYPERLE